MSGHRERIFEESGATMRGHDALLDVIEWLLPAVARRSTYGVSSCKLIRHCLLDEPLDEWERPWDAWDLIGVTRTVKAAPPAYRDKAEAALARFREMMEPGYVRQADAQMKAKARV